MTAQTASAPRDWRRAAPLFVVVGLIGFVVDAGITSLLVKELAVPAALARPPGVAVATIVNFFLNRSLTFQATHLPIWPAFLRYVVVCSAGLAVNYSVYLLGLAIAPAIGVPTTPGFLPLFVAAGVGVGTIFTFTGFHFFAFRERPRG